MPSVNRNAAGFVTPKRANHQGVHPHTNTMIQTGNVLAKKTVGKQAVPLNKVNKRQRKMAAKRMSKLSAITGVATHMTRGPVAKAALPAPSKSAKKTVVEKKSAKSGFLAFSPFDDRFPVSFETYSPWDARFPYGHVAREFPSFSPFDTRFPVNGNGLFRNIYLAKQEEKVAAKRMADYKGYQLMFGKLSTKPAASAKPAAAKAAPAKPASTRAAAQLPSAAFTATQTMTPMFAAFPRFSPMARTGPTNAASFGSGRSNAPVEQSPISAMRTRANGGAAASPTVRRPQKMR